MKWNPKINLIIGGCCLNAVSIELIFFGRGFFAYSFALFAILNIVGGWVFTNAN